jgi:phosphotransferase family enzyme
MTSYLRRLKGRMAMKLAARRTLASAEQALALKTGKKTHFRVRQSFHGMTFRCEVRGDGERSPRSVIVKRVRLLGSQRYDPSDTDPPSPAFRLFNDWAGLEFLSGLAEERLAPRLIAADRKLGYLVMEDVGQDDLGNVLQQGNLGRAETAAHQLASTLGRIHVASLGRRSDFEAIRNRLGPQPPQRHKLPCTEEWFAKMSSDLLTDLAALRVEPLPGFESELAEVAAAISQPGPFLAYTHGDPCPDNLRLADSEAVLIDFEFGRFRHVMTDAVFPRMLFPPTGGQVHRLPDALVDDMESLYRAELVKGCPAAADDLVFRKAILDACAFWLMKLAITLKQPDGSPNPHSLIESDRSLGGASARRVLLAQLAVFAKTAEECDGYPALHDTFLRLRTSLGRLWGTREEDLPLFRSFQRGGA